ncbi:MAG: class I adenylate-forming enzyme family protein [Phycisphaerales bacterium]
MSVHWPIIWSCVRNLRRTLVVDDRRSYKGAEILGASLHIAGAIASTCASRTVGVMLPTGGGFGPAAIAAWSLGKTAVPLNYLLSRDELQYVVDDCETDTIITAKAMLDHMGFAPRVKRLVLLEDVDFRGMPEVRRPATAEPEDLAVLLYTSGTSGRPKGVMLTHWNLESNIRQVQNFVHFSQEDTMLGVLPQFHSFGMTVLTLLPMTHGIKAVYTAKFVPARLLKLIREHRPTIFVAIPSMYNAMLSLRDAKPEDFATLRYAVSGGEPLPEAVADRFRDRFGVTINEGYGLTETSPATNICRPHEWKRHSVGMPLPEMDERIADPNTGASLPANTDGEVQMKGPNIMKGYFKLPKESAAAFTADGYFRTGDIGRFDDDGHLYITGRLKEMLIVGGENVFPREIEEAINSHPSVQDSGVVGVADPMRGELPLAFVEMREGATFDEKAILAHVRERLAGYKVPREIRRVDALPRNPTGKIMRRELRKMI